jgi:hypothetical protein
MNALDILFFSTAILLSFSLFIGIINPNFILFWMKNPSRLKVIALAFTIFFIVATAFGIIKKNMNALESLTFGITGLSVLALFIGLINPNWVLFWMEKPSRLKVVAFSFTLFFVNAIGFPHKKNEVQQENGQSIKEPTHPQPQPISSGFDVIDKDSFRKDLLLSTRSDKSIPGMSADISERYYFCIVDFLANQMPVNNEGKIVLNDEAKKIMNSLTKDEKAFEKIAEKCMINSIFTKIDFNTLKVDIDQMAGRKISVDGVGVYMMDSFVLKKDQLSTNLMTVNIEQLKRNDKIEILNQCSNPVLGCKVMVHGLIDNLGYEKGIVAKAIEFK